MDRNVTLPADLINGSDNKSSGLSLTLVVFRGIQWYLAVGRPTVERLQLRFDFTIVLFRGAMVRLAFQYIRLTMVLEPASIKHHKNNSFAGLLWARNEL